MSPADDYQPPIASIEAEVLAIEAALRKVDREVLLAHKRADVPLVVWRNGQIAWIPADQFSLDDDPPQP